MTFGYGSGIGSGVSFGGSSAYSIGGTATYDYFYDQDYLEKKQDYVEQQDKMTREYSSTHSAVSTKIDNVVYYLSSGREDLTLQAYSQLVEEVASQNPNMTESEIMGFVRSEIEAVLSAGSDNPVSLIAYIKDKTANVDEQATQKTLYFDDCVDEHTEEDLLLAMCGIEEEKVQSTGNKWKNGFLNVITFGLSEIFCGGKKR